MQEHTSELRLEQQTLNAANADTENVACSM